MNLAIPFDAVIVSFLEWLLRTSLSAAAVAGLVLLVQFLFARWLSPAWRYRLWGLVVLRLLLPVVPPSAMSVWNVERWVPSVGTMFRAAGERSRSSHSTALKSDRLSTGRTTSPGVVVRYGSIPPPAPASERPVPRATDVREGRASMLPALAMAIWLAVAAFLLARLLISNVFLSRRLRCAVPVTDAQALDQLDRCCSEARISRWPMLCVTDVVRIPAAAGLWRPAILVPAGLFDRLASEDRRAILLHELAHIACRDIAVNWLMAALQAVHWFNPLLWLAFARLRADRESARDAMVLRQLKGAGPEAAADSYGRTLLKIAELLMPLHGRADVVAGVTGLFGPAAVLLLGFFGRRSKLQRRFQMITHYPQVAQCRSWLGPALAVVLAAAALTRAKDPSRPTATAPASLPVEVILQPDPNKLQAPPEVQRKLDMVLPQVVFDVIGLGDVLHFFGDISGLKITVNWEALQAVGVERTTPVTARLRDIKFSQALSIILDSVGGGQVKLEYVVRNDGLLVSTREEFAKEVQIRIYDIRDLIIPVSAPAGDNGRTGGPATAPTFSPALPATRPAASRDEQIGRLIRLIEDSVAPASWNDPGGPAHARIGEVEGQLIVTQTGENQQAILALLRQVRESRVLRVRIESQLLRCGERTVNDLLAGWHKTVAQPPYAAAEAGIALDEAQVKELLHACQAPGSGDGVTAGAPLTLFNGQQAGMQFAPDNRSYVSGYKPTKSPAGQTQYEPVHDEVHAGFFFDVQATASGDAREVVLGVRLRSSALLRMEWVPWALAPAGSRLQVESPQMKSTELRTTASVPLGQNLLVGGMEDFGIRTGGSLDGYGGHTGFRLFMLIQPKMVIPANVTSQPGPPATEHGAR